MEPPAHEEEQRLIAEWRENGLWRRRSVINFGPCPVCRSRRRSESRRPRTGPVLGCFQASIRSTWGDHVYQTRSLGVGSEGIPDQYADGRAAKVWELYIGEREKRTEHYKEFLSNKLRDLGCHHVLDVACGTGIDSVLLLEEGFKVTSVDASDRMLKYALKIRWNRRKEKAFDDWVIEEANWLTLPDDIVKPASGGFDAVICLGNSFSHLPDSRVAPRNIYYNSNHIKDIQTSVLASSTARTPEYSKKGRFSGEPINNFRLSYFPHRLKDFNELLEDVFGKEAHHEIYGDFKPLSKDYTPAFYIPHTQESLMLDVKRS
ncbi:hypothetical protein MRX96_031854 [Rhipicephalus microplus]